MKMRWSILALCLCLPLSFAWSSDWRNELEPEIGYRIDDLNHKGPIEGGVKSHLEQKIRNIQMVQFTLQDRLTWHDRIFLQGLLGYAHSWNFRNSMHGTFDLGGTDFAAPYDNEGEVLSDPNAQHNVVVIEEYSHHHNRGHAWDFDIALGGIICCQNYFEFMPRIGYIYQSLILHEATDTRFQGGYVGLAFPLGYGQFQLTSDFSYIFAGSRNETIEHFRLFEGRYHHIHVDNGNIHGFRFAAYLDYEINCNWSIGFAWKYLDLRSSGDRHAKIDEFVNWKVHTNWRSNQYLGTLTYRF